jgi:short-subunit dehydrogenase involved in D-alanine esterification of teichoic acids
MNISGNTIFIPGATSGIGLALARKLAQKGNTIIVGGRRQEILDEVTAAQPQIGAVQIDTGDPASIAGAARDVLKRYPSLNVIIAMAGIMRIEDWRRPESFVSSAEEVINTNLLGPIRLLGAFIEHLQRQEDSTFVSVSSGLAFAPFKGVPSYNASKAAIHMLTESLRLQLADTTVRFVELEPPAVATDLLPGQRDDPSAMPLDDFIDEVVGIIEHQPDVREIQVERVKFLRYAEARGDYDAVVAALNGLPRSTE